MANFSCFLWQNFPLHRTTQAALDVSLSPDVTTLNIALGRFQCAWSQISEGTSYLRHKMCERMHDAGFFLCKNTVVMIWVPLDPLKIYRTWKAIREQFKWPLSLIINSIVCVKLFSQGMARAFVPETGAESDSWWAGQKIWQSCGSATRGHPVMTSSQRGRGQAEVDAIVPDSVLLNCLVRSKDPRYMYYIRGAQPFWTKGRSVLL